MPPITRAERLRATSAAAALALVAGACGVFGGGHPAAADDATAATRLEHPRQQCGAAHLPARLPPLAQVIDSAALLAALAGDANWRNRDTYAVLSLTFDGGQPLFPVIVRTNLPPLGKQPPGDSLTALLRRQVLAQAPSDSTWGVRLELRGGSPPSLTLARQELCRPQAIGSVTGYLAIGQGGIPFVVSERANSFNVLDEQQPAIRPVRLRVLVDGEGTVQHVEVPPIPEYRGLDFAGAIQRTAPGIRFYPALRDGVPERAWAPLFAVLGAQK